MKGITIFWLLIKLRVQLNVTPVSFFKYTVFSCGLHPKFSHTQQRHKLKSLSHPSNHTSLRHQVVWWHNTAIIPKERLAWPRLKLLTLNRGHLIWSVFVLSFHKIPVVLNPERYLNFCCRQRTACIKEMSLIKHWDLCINFFVKSIFLSRWTVFFFFKELLQLHT